MNQRGQAILATAMLVAHLAPSVASAADDHFSKTDDEIDKWLRSNSDTYAQIVEDIEARKDLRGYRFASKEDVRRGMVAWVDGYLEIQLNTNLRGASRVTTLIFEIANASRSREHQQIDLAADRELIRTPEEFGLAHEIIEYEALRLHRQILLELESRGAALSKEFFYFVTPAVRSAKDYRLPNLYDFLKAQRDSGHTKHYYKHFQLRKNHRSADPASASSGNTVDGDS